jgi:hypothetical protein
MSQECTTLSGLLTFYSQRANAHASFVVAGMFGIYAVVFNMDKICPLAFWLSYVALLIIDLYSFLNFSFYTTQADILRRRLEDAGGRKLDLDDPDTLKQMDWLTREYNKLRKKFLKGSTKMTLLLVLWLLAVIGPLIGMLVK